MNSIQVSSFWSKVEITKSARDCWEWSGAKKKSGYGNVRIDKKYLLAHRVAFTIANGEIPAGYMVCHICDNTSCCNPSHLMLGSAKSNSADMLIKNRGKKKESAARGAVNGMSKLCDESIREIRRLYSDGSANQYQLASIYNVSQPCIGSILRNKTWRHVL